MKHLKNILIALIFYITLETLGAIDFHSVYGIIAFMPIPIIIIVSLYSFFSDIISNKDNN